MKNKKIFVAVQASSRNWSGGQDLCMNVMNQTTVLHSTLRRIYEGLRDQIECLYIIAPEFDKGRMDFLLEDYPNIRISYSHNASPFLRMLDATKSLNDDDLLLRVNGINFCVDVDAAKECLILAKSHSNDCVKFPDDFPSLFTSDVYRVSALRKMQHELDEIENIYHVHPKYYMQKTKGYSCQIMKPEFSKYPDDLLKQVRKECYESMYKTRIEVDSSKSIASGDQISLHYSLIGKYLRRNDLVLDMACGSGFGTSMLRKHADRVLGIDLDSNSINRALENYGTQGGGFQCCDALKLPMSNFFFDAVVAFEIIEHVNPDDLLREIHRTLKPNGLVALSSPQNSLGHIPSTPDHIIEFSLIQLKEIVGKYFKIEKIIGIKQGCIYFDGDPVGSNTFIVARKI
jgi:2-polyprenyl-3-methyl-5-hydroxy-6-metoxy-1,4-benzoquinol methylase